MLKTGTSTPHRNIFAALAVFSLAALIAVSPASAASTDTGEAASLKTAPEQACAATLHLSPADPAYQACVNSLNESVARVAAFKAENKTLQGARAACAREGVAPDSDGYALCVYNHSTATVSVSAVDEGSN